MPQAKCDDHLASSQPPTPHSSPPKMKASSPDERFTMNSYANGLAAMLQDSSLPVPLLMGVHGKHGSGKTQLIKAVLWKVRRVCGFSCANLGRHAEPAPVRWKYSWCCCCTGGCCASFFGFLLALALVFFVTVGGVISFMIWASVVYHRSVVTEPTPATTVVTPSTTQPPPPPLGNGTAGFAGEEEHAAITNVPLIDFSSNNVLYPLLAASAFMGAGLALVLVTVAVYYCQDRRRDGDSIGQRGTGGGRWQHFKAILIMMLCEPPPLPAVKKHDRVEVIPVVFNAWEYAGCDVLWAGIIQNIFHQAEAVFGKWKLRFYRTFRSSGLRHQHDPSVLLRAAGSGGMPDREINAYFGESMHSRTEAQGADGDAEAAGRYSAAVRRDVFLHTAKWLHVPYPVWALLALSVATVSALIIVLLAVASNLRELAQLEHYIQAAAGVLLGLTALTQLGNVWAILRSVCTSQAGQLEHAIQRMRGPDVTTDLGFMHTVKVEVQRVTGFVRLMERVYQKKFRILIVIDDLDKCEAARIASILDAVSILLSDEDSLFVTLVAIDHDIVADAVAKRAGGGSCCGANGEFLKRLVHMRFHMPEWTASDMESVLDWTCSRPHDCPQTPGRAVRTASSGNNSRKKRHEGKAGDKRRSNSGTGSAQAGVEMALISKADFEDASEDIIVRKKLRRKMTKLAVQELKNQIDLLPKSFCDVRHLCNMVFFTVYLWVDKMHIGHETLETLQQALAETCVRLTWWVILTEEWPYRCSWMLKHVEDMDELELKASRNGVDIDARRQNILLSEVYQHVKDRIKEPQQWKEWMNGDASTELFEMAMDLFPLTCQTIKYFLPFTINLDRTIKDFISEHCKMGEDAPCKLCKGISLSALDNLCLTPTGSSRESRLAPGDEEPAADPAPIASRVS